MSCLLGLISVSLFGCLQEINYDEAKVPEYTLPDHLSARTVQW